MTGLVFRAENEAMGSFFKTHAVNHNESLFSCLCIFVADLFPFLGSGSSELRYERSKRSADS